MEMDVQQIHNMGYWCVVRDQHNNVVCNGNTFVIQNAQTNEIRYLEDTVENRQYLQLSEPPVIVELTPPEIPAVRNVVKQTKQSDPFWDRNKIRLLLTLCLGNKVNNSELNDKDKVSWNDVAPIIGTTAEECEKKYRNLRRTYIRLLKKKQQGRDIKWKHFNTCAEAFQDNKILNSSALELWEDDKVRQLLTLYIDKLNQFRDPDCLKKDIWTEIAQAIGTTDYNCYHKFKNLKRTYFNWLEKSKQTGKLVKWQFHQYFEQIFYNYTPNAAPWDRNKTKLLLQTYLDYESKFSNPKFQKKELWKEIAAIVNETPSNCDRKFRNLKQTYVKLKTKSETGHGTTKWRFYKDFENIYNCNSTIDEVTGLQIVKGSILHRYNEEDYIKQLLNFYIANLSKFRDPLVKKKNLWKQVAPKIGITSDDCDRKFRNLKQTYIRLKEKKNETGKSIKWPYFNYFEQIYNFHPDLNNPETQKSDDESISLPEHNRRKKETSRQEDYVKFDRLVRVVEESNNIQRDRNRILLMLLESRKKT